MRDAPYADWHPHFTPRWLSVRIASKLPRAFTGLIIDPACGSGNLLAAAAIRMKLSVGRLEFLGIDSSIRAVRECRQTLAELISRGRVRVRQGDFLRIRSCSIARGRRVAVIMNPPFKGYGRLGSHPHKRIAEVHSMKGRYNLAHLFVSHTMKIFQPEILIALLPSNWVYSRASGFRARLNQLGGSWTWEDIGDEVFDGINAHVGVLVWRRHGGNGSRSVIVKPKHRLEHLNGVVVHHGVATGHDTAFQELAKIALPFGTTMDLIRGRDVARRVGGRIWVPPLGRNADTALGTRFRAMVPKNLLAELRSRSCVRYNGRRTYQYHDMIPKWFVSTPKLLLPEIVVGRLRVTFDQHGSRLPLHSAIAIKVPTIAAGRLLKRFLLGPSAQNRLLAQAPRLNGGAFRLQTAALRDLPVSRAFLRSWAQATTARKNRRS